MAHPSVRCAARCVSKGLCELPSCQVQFGRKSRQGKVGIELIVHQIENAIDLPMRQTISSRRSLTQPAERLREIRRARQQDTLRVHRSHFFRTSERGKEGLRKAPDRAVKQAFVLAYQRGNGPPPLLLGDLVKISLRDCKDYRVEGAQQVCLGTVPVVYHRNRALWERSLMNEPIVQIELPTLLLAKLDKD